MTSFSRFIKKTNRLFLGSRLVEHLKFKFTISGLCKQDFGRSCVPSEFQNVYRKPQIKQINIIELSSKKIIFVKIKYYTCEKKKKIQYLSFLLCLTIKKYFTKKYYHNVFSIHFYDIQKNIGISFHQVFPKKTV